jgi:hypothetical protein
MDSKVICMHGFSQDEMSKIIKGVSAVVGRGEVAFCTTTDRNLTWPLKKLIEDVTEEHAYMKRFPPGTESSESQE